MAWFLLIQQTSLIRGVRVFVVYEVSVARKACCSERGFCEKLACIADQLDSGNENFCC